jgi:anti-sigma factor RsiW
MSDRWCERIDDYLAGMLTDPQRAEFAAHVASCSGCRQILQEQKRFDALLAGVSVALPPGLIDRIEGRLRRRAKRRRILTVLTAAAMLIAVGSAWALFSKLFQDVPPNLVVESAPPPAGNPDPSFRVQVIFPPDAELIPQPMPTQHPAVTIIWVYPTVSPFSRNKNASADTVLSP